MLNKNYSYKAFVNHLWKSLFWVMSEYDFKCMIGF